MTARDRLPEAVSPDTNAAKRGHGGQKADCRVLVVGGGISGLSLAYFLSRGAPRLQVELAEAEARLGGVLGTETEAGFVFERGPHGFLDNVPETLELVRELGLEARLLSPSPAAKKRYVLRRGRLSPLPAGPLDFLRSPLLSWRGKLRLLSEPWRGRPRSDQDESLASFARRRLGNEAASVLVDALQTGIYAGDIERLSVASAFPRLASMEREHGGLFRALWRARKARRAGAGGSPRPVSPAAASLRSFRGGLGELVQALGDRLGDRVQLRCGVESLSPEGGSVRVVLCNGKAEEFDAVVVALPAPRAAGLFSASRPALAQGLEELCYAPVAVVCLGYRRDEVAHPLDGFGFLVPREEGLASLGMIWASSVFPEHAPQGCVSLRALAGGARHPEVVGRTAPQIEDLVVRELGPLIGLSGEPLVRRVYRYAQGIPQYNVGHGARLERIEAERRAFAGLYLTGNAYRGVGINDCVRESRRLSGEIARDLVPAS
jgi:oxygen-dependent protoporphyrinogen oxidase